ncbi:integrase core domain protein [Leptospira sp. serovar Kenya str. Sh9]|nr:integrase core domain protein [Leptospira sp. serovar Kenya str. Sh9]
MLNDSQAFMNLSTFYKYARALRPDFKRFRKPKQRIGIRASSPLTLLHMDTTILRVQDGSKAYIHFIMDNFSRTILGWKASLEWNAKNTVSNLKEVCEKFNLFHKPIRLLCDDGSENQGAVNGFLDQPNLFIKKLIAQVDISYSNSMIEAGDFTVPTRVHIHPLAASPIAYPSFLWFASIPFPDSLLHSFVF